MNVTRFAIRIVATAALATAINPAFNSATACEMPYLMGNACVCLLGTPTGYQDCTPGWSFGYPCYLQGSCP